MNHFNQKIHFLLFLSIFCLMTLSLNAQNTMKSSDEDAFFIKNIYKTTLTKGQGYDWLKDLATIGGRLSGSPQSFAAIEFTKQMMDTLGMDTVWLQPCIVPHWVRGDKEQVRIVGSKKMGTIELKALALGNSIGTGQKGITAEIVEVNSLDEAEKLGKAGKLRGKIVFYNRPMDNTQINTFAAYGGAVDQRVWGASKVGNYGAVAALVRSMTTRLDDIPHTGVTVYEEGVRKIPTVAISTNDAELLSRLTTEEVVRVFIRTTCKNLSPKLSYNVVGEIKGSEYPDEILLVGGHLDSWDVGDGVHDDGAGCVQSMDVIHVLKQLNYRPKRTLRCVMFMNEENGQAGSKVYTETSNDNKEFHLFAIESDRGGFTPRGFTCDGDKTIFKEKFQKLYAWSPLLEPYGITLAKGGSGADISRLKSQKGLLLGLKPDSQRYFDYHHTAIDLMDTVNKRELQLGAAAMASLIYLVDKYGLGD